MDRTDNTRYAWATRTQEPATVADLIAHLVAMSENGIGIGDVNAAAVHAAADVLRRTAPENGQLFPHEHVVATGGWTGH